MYIHRFSLIQQNGFPSQKFEFIPNENGLIRASTDLKNWNRIMSESGIHMFHYEFPNISFECLKVIECVPKQ